MRQVDSVPPQQNYQHESRQTKVLWERKGILGWWLNLTAPPYPEDMSSLQVREYVRKSELISLVSVVVAAFLLALMYNSLSDPSTAMAASIMAVALFIALILNRLGKVAIASYVIIVFMLSVLMLSLVGAKGGLRLIWFTTFDLFTVPVFLSSLIVRRHASLYCAFVAVVFVLLYYAYEPHALINGFGAHNFDELRYEVSRPYFNWYALINRNVGLIAFSGLFGWLAALSFERSLEWAALAHSEASVATAIAKYKEQSEQDLLQFLQETTQAFAAQANGHAQFIRERSQIDPLHDAVIFLNGQLKKVRRASTRQEDVSASHVLQELKRFTALIDEITNEAASRQALNPEAGKPFSNVEEVNTLARKVYKMISTYRK